MSETMIDEIPSSINRELDHTVKESDVHNVDDETWSYRNSQSKNEDSIDETAAISSIDEITTQEMNARENLARSFISEVDDSDDDDDIIVTIRNCEPEVSTFQINRQKNRQMLPTSPMMVPKPTIARGIDVDAQGIINGQSTYEHDIANAYKDEEKPWKKPGADITDYFNYGFTEETWGQYSDRQRRLRAENNLARLNVGHMPQMPPMMVNHPPMGHPMNPHAMMMMNRPMNMQMMTRPPMNIRKPDGKIGVIGTTDQTSRRSMFEPSSDFEHPSFINGSPFHSGQPQNEQTVGDLITTPSPHGIGPNGSHQMSTLGAPRLSLIPLQPGMQFRPQFGPMHGLGGSQFFPRVPVAVMHGDRPSQPYFIPHHPQQAWDKTAGIPLPGFPPGSLPSQTTVLSTGNNERGPSSRSATPENHSTHSATPEENRANKSANGGNEKSSKDDRYQERYRNDREPHSSSRSHNRTNDHEYERPRNDRKSSRDRDDKYERDSRKRHHKNDSNHHHRSSHRTPTKTNPISNELSQTLNDQSESTIESNSSSLPVNRSYRDDAERSSSHHNHHKKSSKRSRHDSDDERNSSYHH